MESLEQLYEACFNLTPIDQQTRLSPALRIEGRVLKDHPWAWNIMGTYGIQIVVPTDEIASKKALVAGNLGFSLDNQDMVITNSPQGLGRDVLKRLTTHGLTGDSYSDEQISQVMKVLKTVDPQTGWNFRDQLLVAAIKVAHSLKDLGINRIVGVAAENHPKVVISKSLPLETAQKLMDRLL